MMSFIKNFATTVAAVVVGAMVVKRIGM